MIAGAPSARRSPERFFLLLAAAFTMAMGYGVILPVLPFFLERLPTEAGVRSVSWHTGLLTGVYMFALFAFAPLWGRVSDRIGRRPVILLGLAGFVGTMVLFGLARNVEVAYLARILGGLFASAVLPVTLAYVGDDTVAERRARGFAWLSAANALGFLAGPALSGGLAGMGLSVPPSIAALPTGIYALPLFAVAALGGLVCLGICFRFVDPATPSSRPADQHTPAQRPRVGITLLLLTLLAMFGLGSFEVGITLQGQQILDLGPAQIGLMFTECALVMIAVQGLVFSPLVKRVGGRPLLAPLFLAMAAGMALFPFLERPYLLMIAVGLVAATSGILIPGLTYLVSLAAGAAQGTALGRQTAASSLGQALGSAVTGLLFAMLTQAPFWFAAGLLLLGVAVCIVTPRNGDGIGSGEARAAPWSG